MLIIPDIKPLFFVLLLILNENEFDKRVGNKE